MQKKLQKKLELNYSKNVLDIVQFGSSIVAGKLPNDIDIAVIFQKIPLKEQLEEAQNLKNQISKYFDKPIHIQSYDLYSLFQKGNFASESILFYGRSLIFNRYFSELFGITPKIQISYSLVKLEKKDKVRFNYLLNGKGGSYGLLREYFGRLLNPGLIQIDPEYEHIFVNSLAQITKEFKVNKIFVSSDNS
jgi:predicted nucleotidyltransferase